MKKLRTYITTRKGKPGKLVVDETDLFYIRCAAAEFLERNPDSPMYQAVLKALENTKAK